MAEDIHDRWAHVIAERDAAESERDRLRAVVEAVRPYITLLPVEVAEGIIGIEPIEYVNQERGRMLAALADISRAVMPDVGHGGNYGFVVAAAESIVAERDRLRAANEGLEALIDVARLEHRDTRAERDRLRDVVKAVVDRPGDAWIMVPEMRAALDAKKGT